MRDPGLASNANLDPLIGVCNLVGTGFAVKGWKEPMQLQFVGSLFKFKFVHSIIFRVSYIYIYLFSGAHFFDEVWYAQLVLCHHFLAGFKRCIF